LAEHFLEGFRREAGRELRLQPDALKWLLAQDWPGNVRELKNILEQAALLANEGVIRKADLTSIPAPASENTSTGLFRSAKKAYVESFERNYLRNLLTRTQGNVSEAARRAGVARRNFQVLLKKYHLSSAQFKK
jgi:DNA-binding NtrC family response regulator